MDCEAETPAEAKDELPSESSTIPNRKFLHNQWPILVESVNQLQADELTGDFEMKSSEDFQNLMKKEQNHFKDQQIIELAKASFPNTTNQHYTKGTLFSPDGNY